MNDPDTLVKISWFALEGTDALNALDKNYRDITDKAIKDFKKNYGKQGTQHKPTVAIKPKPDQSSGGTIFNPTGKQLTMNDLD